MAAEVGVVLLKLVVLLGAAKLAGELAERIRQPAVLGELLAGFLLGPTLLGFVDLQDASDASAGIVAFVAQLGVLLLLFEVGLETKLADLVRVGPSSLLVALLGIVGAFAAGFGVSWALGAVGFWSDHVLFHVFVGATFTATSVGITARVLSDLGRLATSEARIVLGAAVLDDVGGLLILAVISTLASGNLDPAGIATQGALSLAFLVVALAIGMRSFPWLMDKLSLARVRGVTLAAAVGFALLMAYLAEVTGLAGIVGAFAAGLILANTRQHAVISERVRHVADVFVPFFFVYVGLQLDLRGAGEDAARIGIATLILTLAAIAGKVIAGLGVVERGVDRLAVGVGMVPRGEVGLIFALVGLTTTVNGVPLMAPWEYAAILLVVVVTTFLTPIWLQRVLTRPRVPT